MNSPTHWLAPLLLAALCLASPAAGRDQLGHRWLFVRGDLRNPPDVERALALLPRAAAAGYNAVVLDMYLDPAGAQKLTAAARQCHLDLIPTVMGGLVGADRNLAEGVPVKDALFVAHGGTAAFVQDTPTPIPGGDFETADGDRFQGWEMQDDPGVTTFADHEAVHGGRTSLRMDHIGAGNPYGNCRLARPVTLHPFRQYLLKVWVKTDGFADPGLVDVKLLTDDGKLRPISYQSLGLRPTQDWTLHSLGFNSLDHTSALLYLGVWGGKGGRIWWDDLSLEEVGLLNVLRRPGTPVSVRSESGVVFEEGRDFEPIRDPNLHPWVTYHELPVIRLTPATRIREGERLRVSYYHPVIIYEDRIDTCLSEPEVFALWREQIERADQLLHPPAFFMSHDEIRVANWCQACQSRHLTPAQLLADNVRRAVAIIREIRPDAEIWVWSDMFDPHHNAVDDYYLVNGSWRGSWEGLSPQVGIANWRGGERDTMEWFAGRGHRQVLCGYYDGDEDGAGIARWRDLGHGLPGLVGAMYTTWQDRYGAMEAWAKQAWGETP